VNRRSFNNKGVWVFWGIIGTLFISGIIGETITTTPTARDVATFIFWVITYAIYLVIVYFY
jgi:hypothetical protein